MKSLPLLELREDGFAGVSLSSGLQEVNMRYLTTIQFPHRLRLRTRHRSVPPGI